MKKRYIISFVVAIIILSVLFLWNVGAGSVDISTSDLFAILAGSGKDETFSQIVWKIRLPRILAAILLGGALSVSGFLLQSFFQNPIAGPYVLGISSGAKLVVALTMIFAGKRHYDQFLWHGYGCVCGFHTCHGIRAFNFISRVKNVAAGGLWDHDRLYLFRHHGLLRHICQRFEYRQSSQLVDGKFFRHDMGKYKNDRRDRRRSSACDFLSGKTDRGISDGGGICQKYWCQCKSVEGHDDSFIKPSVCLRDCICGTDLLCRNCSAASGEDGDKNSAPDYPDSGVFFVWCSCDTFL